jgi:hypothetical protein
LIDNKNHQLYKFVICWNRLCNIENIGGNINLSQKSSRKPYNISRAFSIKFMWLCYKLANRNLVLKQILVELGDSRVQIIGPKGADAWGRAKRIVRGRTDRSPRDWDHFPYTKDKFADALHINTHHAI